MKNNTFNRFDSVREKRFTELKSKFLDAMKVARQDHEIKALNIFRNDFDEQWNKKWNYQLKSQFGQILAKIKDNIDINKHSSFESEFTKWLAGNKASIDKKNILLLGEYKAESDFWDYIRTYEIKLNGTYINPENNGKEKTTKHEKPVTLKLSDIFDSPAKYEDLMQLLVEKKYCAKDTFIWQDEGKGNKGLLVAILKHLHTQGYYKENKRLSNSEIKEIAKNTFGIDISSSTIEKANPKVFDVSFIHRAASYKSHYGKCNFFHFP